MAAYILLLLKKEEVMKFKKLMLVPALILQVAALNADNKMLLIEDNNDFDETFGFVNLKSPTDEIIDEFILIDNDKKHIIETSDKATPVIGWQFEIYNNSFFTAYVAVRSDSQQVLPSSEKNAQSLLAGQFFKLLPNQSVRIAGLDSDKLLRLIVLDGLEAQHDIDYSIIQSIKKQGRARVIDLNNDSKAYFEIDRDFNLIQLRPSVTQTTKSGLSLTK